MSKHTFTDLFLTSPQNKKVHLHDLVFKAAVPYYYSPALERHYVEKNLEEGWLWMSEDGVTAPIKISGYCFDCYNTQESTMLVVGFKDIAIYHVRDILKNKEHFYNAMKKEFVKANRSKIDREGLSNAGKTD